MKAIDVLKLNREALSKLDEMGVPASDYRYIALYDDFMQMQARGDKVSYIVATLADKHGVGERTIYSVIRRLTRCCNV